MCCLAEYKEPCTFRADFATKKWFMKGSLRQSVKADFIYQPNERGVRYPKQFSVVIVRQKTI